MRQEKDRPTISQAGFELLFQTGFYAFYDDDHDGVVCLFVLFFFFFASFLG